VGGTGGEEAERKHQGGVRKSSYRRGGGSSDLRGQERDEGTDGVEEAMGDFRRKSPCAELLGHNFLLEKT
jgi:hypothetical protein